MAHISQTASNSKGWPLCEPIIKMSLKHCLLGLTEFMVSGCSFLFDCSYSCAQSLSVAESRASACALILCTIPGCQRKGQAYSQRYTHCGQKGSDGLGGRLLCGLVLAGLSHYAQGHPTHRGPVGSPPCSVSSLVDGCAAPLPRSCHGRCDDAVKMEGQLF